MRPAGLAIPSGLNERGPRRAKLKDVDVGRFRIDVCQVYALRLELLLALVW